MAPPIDIPTEEVRKFSGCGSLPTEFWGLFFTNRTRFNLTDRKSLGKLFSARQKEGDHLPPIVIR